MKVTRLDLPVMSSWIDRSESRLDASPFLSGAFEARAILERLAVRKDTLSSLTLHNKKHNGIFIAPYFKRVYVNDPKLGIPLLGNNDILTAEFTGAPLLSRKVFEEYKEGLELKEGWTLITCFGTVGKMAYCREDMAKCAGSTNFMRVVPDPQKVLPGYLYAFLSSRFGLPIITEKTTGSIIENLLPSHIQDLPVPRLGEAIEAEVHQKVQEASRLRTEYQTQVKQATDLLFESVGLRDITSAEWHQEQEADLGFAHDLDSHTSLRAANFTTRFKKLCDSIRSSSYKELGEICIPGTLKRGDRFKRVDAHPDHGCQLIGQRQLFWIKPEGRCISPKAAGDVVFLKPGTILTAARGTLGESELYCRSEFIWDKALELAYSEDLLRTIADETIMPRGCLFAFMRSETAFRMLRSISFGSKLQDHHAIFLYHLPVPYPESSIQQEIHELVVDAYEKRHLSNALEDEAIQLVETAIEEGANG